jgi:hypothetical protein
MMFKKAGLIGALLVVGACTRGSVPVETVVNQRLRPDWTSQLAMQVDAMRGCVELRESPRYVVFLDSLPSGATGVTTIDAYGAIEHCAWLQGAVVRREPTQWSAADIAEAGGVLFSVGPTMPVIPEGNVIEEVIDDGAVVGWLYWPGSAAQSEEPKGAAEKGARS